MRSLGVSCIAVAGLATGCDWIVGISALPPPAAGLDALGQLDGSAGQDAASDSDCRNHLEFVPVPPTQFPGLLTDYVPTITANLTDAFDVHDSGNGFDLREFQLVRGMFEPVDISSLNSPSLEDDPALSADGLDMIFVSTRQGTTNAYETTRSSLAAPWTAPNPPMGLNGAVIAQVDLSPDGLTLYLVSASHDLYQATRLTRLSPFVTASGGPIATDARNPTVSGDGLELIMESASGALGPGVSELTRSSPNQPFAGQIPIQALPAAYDVDLSPDGHFLLTGGGQYYVRSCQ